VAVSDRHVRADRRADYRTPHQIKRAIHWATRGSANPRKFRAQIIARQKLGVRHG
jgi:hypothetical protein